MPDDKPMPAPVEPRVLYEAALRTRAAKLEEYGVPCHVAAQAKRDAVPVGVVFDRIIKRLQRRKRAE